MAASSVDAASLVEQFPALSADDRIALLRWARETPLVYGAWKPFKALYKKAEAPALGSDGSVDVELLGVLLGRLDAAPIPRELPHLQPVEVPANISGRSDSQGNITYTGTGRTRWDYSGWRLVIAIAGEGVESSQLRQRLEGLRRALGLTPGATPARRAAWDFNARDYIGEVKSVRLDGALLRIKTEYGRSSKASALDVSDPAFPHFITEAPRPATWQYMKRRARRLLRETRRKRPDVFWPLMLGALRESGRDEVDLDAQWAAMDALYARSERWQQKRPGRGPYARTERPAYNRLKREEAAPEIWDAHLDDVRALFLDERVPVQANATALKVLWSHKMEAPSPGPAQVQRFLNGLEPILQSVATRAVVAQWQAGREPVGGVAAAAYLLAGARVRQALRLLIEARLSGPADSSAWRQSFGAQLLKTLDEAPRTRRGRTAARLAFERLPDLISDDALWRHLELWLSLGRDDVWQWLLARVQASGARGELDRLSAITALPEAQRETLFQAFLSQATNSQPAFGEAIKVVGTGDEGSNKLGWRYLAASAMTPEHIRSLWQNLLRNYSYNEPILRPACSDAAVILFARAEWTAKDIERWFHGYHTPWDALCRYATPDFFDAALGFLPPANRPRQVFVSLSKMPAAFASEAFARHRELARDYHPSSHAILAALISTPGPFNSPAVAPDAIAAAWRFLAETAVEPAVLREVWHSIFGAPIPEAAIAAVVRLFERAQIAGDEVEAWLNQNPEMCGAWAPALFVAFLEVAGGATKVVLVLRARPQQWQAARPALLRLMRDPSLRASVWNGVFERLREAAADAADGRTARARAWRRRTVRDFRAAGRGSGRAAAGHQRSGARASFSALAGRAHGYFGPRRRDAHRGGDVPAARRARARSGARAPHRIGFAAGAAPDGIKPAARCRRGPPVFRGRAARR